MTEKQGASTRMMYQIFVALHRKEVMVHCDIYVSYMNYLKMNSTSQSIESVRSDGKFKLEQIESSIFQEVSVICNIIKYTMITYYLQNLKLQTPRQVDLNFEELIKKFKGRHEKYKALLTKERYIVALEI